MPLGLNIHKRKGKEGVYTSAAAFLVSYFKEVYGKEKLINVTQSISSQTLKLCGASIKSLFNKIFQNWLNTYMTHSFKFCHREAWPDPFHHKHQQKWNLICSKEEADGKVGCDFAPPTGWWSKNKPMFDWIFKLMRLVDWLTRGNEKIIIIPDTHICDFPKSLSVYY